MRSDQLKLPRAANCVSAPGGVELSVDALDVRLDRVHGDEELARDVGVGHHGRQIAMNLELAFGQRIEQLSGGGSAALAAVEGGKKVGREPPVRRGVPEVLDEE